MIPVLPALLIIATFADQAPPPIRGRLCVAERKTVLTEGTCADVEGAKPQIAPSDRERLFVWTSADAKTVQVGLVPAKAAAVELEFPERREVKLSIAGEPARGWPADTTISVLAKEQWRWVIPAKAVPRLERLLVASGSYGLQVEAERHRMFRRRPFGATDTTQTIGEQRLEPLPAARGVVVDREGKPVANAEIAFEDAAPCTHANEQGAFTCELPERKRVEVLVVSAPGFAAQEALLPRVRSEPEMDLGRIVLATGQPLTVKVVRPDAEKPARVTLFYDAPMRHELSKIGTREVTEREQEVKFDAVAAGKYLVLVEGSGPLERLEVPVEVKEGVDASATIEVEPYRLEGFARLGDEPFEGGTVEILAPDHTWRETLTVAQGAFGGTMWQHGKLTAFVKAPGFTTGELVHSPDLGDDPSRWDVKIEKRMIVGRVLDAETKSPVKNIDVNVVTQFDDHGRAYYSVKTGDDGSYKILANRPGTYLLKVASPEHVAFATEVAMTAEDRTRTVDLPLERGVLQPLEIVTPAFEPLGNATILEGVQDDRVNPRHMSRADASGRFQLRGKAGESRLLYVVPRNGSFAVARVVIPRGSGEAKPIQVIVAPPTSSLRVRTVNKEDKPVPAPLLIRYNGEFVPRAIARFVTHDSVGTNRAGEGVLSRFPAGTYELWATAGDEDEMALIASGGTLRPPVRVGLSGGEQAVTVVAPASERPPRRGSAN